MIAVVGIPLLTEKMLPISQPPMMVFANAGSDFGDGMSHNPLIDTLWRTSKSDGPLNRLARNEYGEFRALENESPAIVCESVSICCERVMGLRSGRIILT